MSIGFFHENTFLDKIFEENGLDIIYGDSRYLTMNKLVVKLFMLFRIFIISYMLDL